MNVGFHSLVRASTQLWQRTKQQFPTAPKPFVRFLQVLLVLTFVSWAATSILWVTGNDKSQEAWTTNQVISATHGRLHAIATALDSVRDRLAADPAIRYYTRVDSLHELFQLLRQRDSVYSTRLADTSLMVNDRKQIADHGLAVYSATGHLLAWYSTRSVTFEFDTALTGEMLLRNRDKGMFLQDEPVFTYLTAIRKLVSKEGVLEGYVENKRLLATKELLGQRSKTSFVQDLEQRAQRSIDLKFGGVPASVSSNASWVRTDLFADQSDPASFVGSLGISRQTTGEKSLLYHLLDGLWRLGGTLLFLAALTWLFFAIAEPLDERRPLLTRLWFSVIVLGSAIIVRVIIAYFDGASIIVGQAYRNPSDFMSSWGFGMAQNPLELFITSVFATAAAVMLWIVWMPRQRLVRDDSKKKDIDQIVRRESWMLVLFMIAVAFGMQLLADGLSSTVGYIVLNGSIRYTTVHQVLPPPGLLMMLVAFLGFGVAYLFVVSLLLTFALRAAIFLISRRLSLLIRIIGGSVVLGLLMAMAVFISDQWAFSEITLLYRAALSLLVFIISLSVISIDALSPDPVEGGPSFLYKLPRSSRSILFILAIATLIMSPLIASKQLAADKVVAARIVRENASVSASELTASVTHVLSAAKVRLGEWSQSGRDSSTIRQLAFLSWLDQSREHPTWQVNINIEREDPSALTLSHFSTNGTASELSRISPVLDTFRSRFKDSAKSVVISVIPSVTTAGGPVAIGLLNYRDTGKTNPGVDRPLRVTVSLWTDLPVLAKPSHGLDLITSSNSPFAVGAMPNNPVEEGSFIISVYRPNARRITNAPWIDVPAMLPLWTYRALKEKRSLWQETSISNERYETLFYGLDANQSVITVSLPEPTYAKTMEFALRLNAIGLIYGAIIVLALLLARQIAVRRVRFVLRFRDRIFLVVLLISLVPLIVVTNVTRELLSSRAQNEEQDRLARDASVIKDRITRVVERSIGDTASAGLSHARIQEEVQSLSQIIGRDFSVFDAKGRLRASSRPELYESSVFSNVVSSRAFEELLFGNRAFFRLPVQVGDQLYEASYQPIANSQGSNTLAIVSLITLHEGSHIDAEVARTTTFIYGIFAALGLVLLGIGALFAARVALPIMQLIQATERVAKGKLQTSIDVTRDDEIGELMQSFNQMTLELEKSREIVAQTERELAWKEMARQVAHEIKNPLTPMKLSVQHLEHAHEAKDPNFNTIFRRVIRTLREQIDVLTRIATEFSRFGAMPRRKWGPVNLRRVCESAVALFDADRNRIRFIIDVPKELPLLHSDEDELRRAFVNLLRNAVQAIEGWGVVVIHAEESEGMIHLRLRDTGYGMSEETLSRAFDPNFSTKTSGMGLGLALVKKTITDMSGAIRVESHPGQGTTFFIDLPARGYIEEEE